METRQSSDDTFDRMESTLDGIKSPELLVIKGHLLIERGLWEAVSANLPAPGYLERARMGFYQIAMLARAMCLEQEDFNPFWDAIEALNSLRNRLAHRLELGDLRPLLNRICVLVDPPNSLSDPDIVTKLNHSLGALISFTTALVALIERRDRTAGKSA